MGNRTKSRTAEALLGRTVIIPAAYHPNKQNTACEGTIIYISEGLCRILCRIGDSVEHDFKLDLVWKWEVKETSGPVRKYIESDEVVDVSYSEDDISEFESSEDDEADDPSGAPEGLPAGSFYPGDRCDFWNKDAKRCPELHKSRLRSTMEEPVKPNGLWREPYGRKVAPSAPPTRASSQPRLLPSWRGKLMSMRCSAMLRMVRIHQSGKW